MHLSWFTEEISSARLERRAAQETWRSLGRLSPDGAGRISYEDRDVTPGATYEYRLAVDAGGREIYLGQASVTIPLAANALALARASGAADARTIIVSLTLPRASAARLELFDVSGRLRASRSLEGLGTGDHEVSLAAGQPLGPGIYLMRLAQDGEKATHRFSLSR